MEVNCNTTYTRGIKILIWERFGFHNKDFFTSIFILKNNTKTLTSENEIDFPFSSSIPTFQTRPKDNWAVVLMEMRGIWDCQQLQPWEDWV